MKTNNLLILKAETLFSEKIKPNSRNRGKNRFSEKKNKPNSRNEVEIEMKHLKFLKLSAMEYIVKKVSDLREKSGLQKVTDDPQLLSMKNPQLTFKPIFIFISVFRIWVSLQKF